MDARSYPRSRLSMPVELRCSARNYHLRGKVQDVSTGGMFVIATTPVQTGWQFDILMDLHGSAVNRPRIHATVQRITSQGFGLQFRSDGGTHQIIEDILQPKWDGEDVCEGLIIFAAREQVVGFSEWLRLTSLVCNQYRRCARAQAHHHKTGRH